MSTNYVVTLDKCIEFVTLAGVFASECLARWWISNTQAVRRKHGLDVHGYMIFKMKVNEPGSPTWSVHVYPDGTDNITTADVPTEPNVERPGTGI